MFGTFRLSLAIAVVVTAFLVVNWSPARLDLFSSLAVPVHFLVLCFFAVLGITLEMSFFMALVLEGPTENMRLRQVNKPTHLMGVP